MLQMDASMLKHPLLLPACMVSGIYMSQPASLLACIRYLQSGQQGVHAGHACAAVGPAN